MTDSPRSRLSHSASPYLRSAAHQPVEWYEWGEAAFERARTEEKPVLLDIGAVWCHWCHVIDRESYENPEIAEIINRHFVAVKVDRDERPDVDARYQSAISAISGQGGWPLTGFLTPDGKPFFGGTYFPPEDAMGRPGFRRILLSIAEAFRTRKGDVDRSAASIEEAVAQAELFAGGRGAMDEKLLPAMMETITVKFDARNGGFGQSPKFPHTSAVDLLLEQYQSARESSLLRMAETTLEKMALGGVHDQLGGGFHRYSVDERWIVPHFEKMSYDNSELLKNYLHGFQVTAKPLFRETAEGIIGWVLRDLSDPARGGFYSSQDADYSLDDDGDFFTWTLEELRVALSAEEARVLELYYDVGPHGEMHHNPAKNVLWVARSAGEIATQLGQPEAEVLVTIASGKRKLLAARAARPTPAIDRTLYTNWNAMMASAFLEAAHVLDRADCREFALRTIDRVLAEAWRDASGFAHRVDGEAPRLDGVLDDQIFMAQALLDAFESTGEQRYFDAAERAMQLGVEKYGDPDAAGFFDRAGDAPPLGGLEVRRKPFQDSPTPGANAVACIVLERLYGFTCRAAWRDWAQQTLEAFAGIAPQYGLFAATYGLALVLHQRHTMQVVISGGAEDPRAASLERAAHSVYRLGKSVIRATPGKLFAGALPAGLRDTLLPLDADAPRAFVCVETSCQPPAAEPETLRELLLGI